MLNAFRSMNPIWAMLLTALVASVLYALVVAGVELGYFAHVSQFFVAVWSWLVHMLASPIRAL